MTKFGVLVVAVSLLILTGAGLLIFQSHSNYTAPVPVVINPNPTPTPEPIPTPEPTPTPTKTSNGYVSGHVTIGPFCPVEREGEPCNGPADAYTSREAIAYASDSVTVKARTHLSATGDYTLTLPAGQYLIQISPAGIGPGEKKLAIVKASETATVNFDIDTGIR